MEEAELVEYFRAQIREDPDVASAVAAIRSLLEFLKRDQSETILGLRENMTKAIHRLEETDSSVAVSSGGELFLRFISLTSLEHPVGSAFHKLMAQKLCNLNIPVTVVLDAAVGYIMEKVDLVIVGAEGVVESGGVINKIGTYQMAVCSKAHNKPFYVVAESFKFVRLYPLNQQDVPDRFKYKADILKTVKDLNQEHPMIDYTPPSLITLLFTDLGVLTPSAVSDELIKLYL
ncbi:translation initiation factor eIF-2B subunit alpha [Sinocyclocheilus grahami]|uniref:translation initiation factor eIF-2B subunit alpha n=1 Tax=Sinocyclocheilus grahami TaxID=75366 RepID=UPI0007ACD3CA|nr:PREDICTED: translation initiation factor eIF-2B subunit alpha [Sinocyclocheilus grahami]